MITKLLDLLILVVPYIVELFKNQRAEDESPAGFIKRQQEEELKTYEAMQKKDGGELSRTRELRLRIIAERLRRKGIESANGKQSVSTEGTRLRTDQSGPCPMHVSRRADD